MIGVPESPRYLLSKGKESDARRSLCWLRGGGEYLNVDAEVQEVIRCKFVLGLIPVVYLILGSE